jgi:hypothetical protein
MDSELAHFGKFFSNHWQGIIVGLLVFFLLSPLTTFPGGNPKTLWWVCGGVCVFICFFIYWAFLVLITAMSPEIPAQLPSTTQPATSPETTKPVFRATTKVVIIGGNIRHVAGFCALHDVNGVKTVTPISSGVCISFTNMSDHAFMVESFSLEARPNEGGWNKRPIVSTKMGHLYWATNPGKASRIVIAEFSAATENKMIAPRETVEGWIFFNILDLYEGTNLRLRITDTSGNEYLSPIETPKKDLHTIPVQMQAAFEVLPGRFDLSAYPVEVWWPGYNGETSVKLATKSASVFPTAPSGTTPATAPFTALMPQTTAFNRPVPAAFSIVGMNYMLPATKRNNPTFTIVYGDAGHEKITPVSVAIFVKFTNRSIHPCMVSSYTVEMKSSDGTWKPAVSVPVQSDRLFMGDDLHNMHRYKTDIFDSLAKTTRIATNQTIRGWLFLNMREYESVENLRMCVRDQIGYESTQDFEQFQGEPVAEDIAGQPGMLKWVERIDISRFPVELYLGPSTRPVTPSPATQAATTPSGTPPFSVAMSWQGGPNWFVGSLTQPIEMSFIIELTSLKSTRTMIRSYELQEEDSDGQWQSADAIPAGQTKDARFFTGGDLKAAKEVKYTCFDSVIANKNIDPGETVRGWVFLQRWPIGELRLKIWGMDGSVVAVGFRPIPTYPSEDVPTFQDDLTEQTQNVVDISDFIGSIIEVAVVGATIRPPSAEVKNATSASFNICEYGGTEKDRDPVIEIQPKRDKFLPCFFAVDASEQKNFVRAWIAVSGNPLRGSMMANVLSGETVLSDGTTVWCFQANNTVDKHHSLYVRCKIIPPRLWIGEPEKIIYLAVDKC